MITSGIVGFVENQEPNIEPTLGSVLQGINAKGPLEIKELIVLSLHYRTRKSVIIGLC